MTDLIVQMTPGPGDIPEEAPSGISTVVEKYTEHLRDLGVRIVSGKESTFDVMAVHAGTKLLPEMGPFVCHCHGLYWTAHADQFDDWQWEGNAEVINNIRAANIVTVPSEWVAETMRRDMHMSPAVVPHGIDIEEWEHDFVPMEWGNYVLWNKNRRTDACDPTPLSALAELAPMQKFVSTFTSKAATPNILLTGTQPHFVMKDIIKRASVYLATTKETFGIGTLEAMAAGVPILGFDYGGTGEICTHGHDSYLAKPGDYDDLRDGLMWILSKRDEIGAQARETARQYSWSAPAKMLVNLYHQAVEMYNTPHDCTIVIPCYNKAKTLKRTVDSALKQTKGCRIIIVDNNSTDASRYIMTALANDNEMVEWVNEEEQGVAHARNRGIRMSDTRYICCLDSDDEIKPRFIETCISALITDRSLGLAYTRMDVINADGELFEPGWPDKYDFGAFVGKVPTIKNPVPTCCVFRRDLAVRLGGYRQRYAPDGAGAEDAEFWMRMGAIGYPGVLASRERLFVYHLGGQVSGNPNYMEADWTKFAPYKVDERYPFAAPIKPVNGVSHPVRFYDEPYVSVVIPCHTAHTKYIRDALDSLQGQYFRLWECVVCWDGVSEEDVSEIEEAYPWVIFVDNEGEGAGAARNTGVRASKAPYILYLDADDWLEPDCISTIVSTSRGEPDNVIYTDYYGRAFGVSDTTQFSRVNRLIHYEEDTQYAVILYYAADYDCNRAQAQPELQNDGEFYIWNLITSLVPRWIHDEIEGFDEEMVSWEDWDYWLRIANAGHCFTRISVPLVSYRFYTGGRREIGRQNARELITYLQDKYSKEAKMACRGCGSKRSSGPATVMHANNLASPQEMAMSASEMVKVVSMDNGSTVVSIRDHETNQVHNYGKRRKGEQFLMMRRHAQSWPNRFEIVGEAEKVKHPSPVESAPVEQAVEEPAENSEKIVAEIEAEIEKQKERPSVRKRGRSSKSRGSS